MIYAFRFLVLAHSRSLADPLFLFTIHVKMKARAARTLQCDICIIGDRSLHTQTCDDDYDDDNDVVDNTNACSSPHAIA